jgi:hypothetical protein
MSTEVGIAAAQEARNKRQEAANAATIAALDAEHGETRDLTPEVHDAAGGHDRTNHNQADHDVDLSKVQGLVSSMMPTKVQLERMTLEQVAKCMRLIASLAVGCDVKEVAEAACVVRAFAFSPASNSNDLLDEAAVLLGTNVYHGNVRRATTDIEQYAHNHQIDLQEVADDFNEDAHPSLQVLRKRRRVLEMAPVAVCERVAEITREVNEWTPGKGAATHYTRLTHGNELLLLLAQKAGFVALPSAARRTKLCLGEWPQWIEFCEQMLEYQAAELRAGLRTDPPWITPDIAKGWIRGEYKDFSVYGAAGPEVARAAIKNWLNNPKHVPSFNARDPKRHDKNGTPMRMFTLEHIDDCSEEVASAKRAGFQCIGANNPYGFAIFPDAFNNSDLMKDNSMSTAKRAFWTVRICLLARSSKQELTMELAGLGAKQLALLYKSGARTYKRKAPSATAATRAAQSNLANCPFQAKLEALQAPQHGASGNGDSKGAGSSSTAANNSDTADTEGVDLSDEGGAHPEQADSDDEGVGGEELNGAYTPPGLPPPSGQSAKAAGKQRAKLPAGTPAAKKPKTGAAAMAMPDTDEEPLLPAEPWMADYPAEYRTQDGLPQTAEAFANQKALDARDRVRKYPPEKSNNSVKCNAFNPKTRSHCNTAAGKAVGKAKLTRCEKHGGPSTGRGICKLPGCNVAQQGNVGGGYCKSAHKKQHEAILVAQKSEGFVPPPPPSALSAAAAAAT